MRQDGAKGVIDSLAFSSSRLLASDPASSNRHPEQHEVTKNLEKNSRSEYDGRRPAKNPPKNVGTSNA